MAVIPIAEDVGFGDLTTRTLGISGQPGRISFAARDPMVACATEEAARILTRLGAVPRLLVASGEAVVPGTLLLEATGDAAALLAGWKVVQTLIEWSAGIAARCGTCATRRVPWCRGSPSPARANRCR